MLSASDRTAVKPYVLTAAYYISLALLGLTSAAAGPSLPTLAGHTASPLDRVSLIFVADAFGYLVGSLAGGRLFDRLPGHRLMAGMLLMMSAAAVALPLARQLWLLLLLALLIGLAKGAVDVGCNTLLQWIHGKSVGPFMNGLHFAYGVGALTAPLLLAQILVRTNEIYWVFWILALLLLPLAAWLCVLPEPRAHADAASRSPAAIPVLPVSLMMLAFVLYVGAEMGFSNWIYTYATSLGLADKISAAYLTSAYWALFTVGRLLGIWVSTRLSSRMILFLDFVGCLLSLGLIELAQGSTSILWIGSIGLGISTASIFPTLLILAGERLQVTGTITGWFLLGGGVGAMLLPWLIGQAFTMSGPRTMIPILFADMLLGLLAVVLFLYGSGASQRRASLANPRS